MGRHFSKGETVEWTWGAHQARGRVAERFTHRVVRVIEGEKVVRNASDEEPAYLIRQDDGGRVLKSESELRHAGGR